MEKVPCTKNILRMVALATLMIAASGCSIIFPYEPPGCEPLNEVCPDLACDAYQVEDGCAICECADEPVDEGCFSDDDCGQNQRCNTEDFCDAPPGCEPGEPCPDVCYGRCEVVVANDCISDADCNEGEFCQFDFTTDPAPPPDGPEEDGEDSDPEELVAQSGQCVPFEECDDFERRAPPVCPEGFELDIDFTFDPCGEFVCKEIDSRCGGLSIDQCEQEPGCEIEFREECDCDGGEPDGEGDEARPCICEGFEVCVPSSENRCEEIRDIGQCENTEGCRAVFPTDGGGGNGFVSPCFDQCDGDEACMEDCENADPAPPIPPEEFFCIEDFQEECFSDFDCAPGSECIDGQCIGGQSDCFELSPEQCDEGRGCELLEVECDCSEEDPNCLCPGNGLICVPSDGPSPDSCVSDNDCDDDETCIVFEECRECGPGENCDEECQFMGECVARLGPPPCESDSDCFDGEACIDSQCQVGASLCLDDGDCPDGLRCATEQESCSCPAGEQCDTCFSMCVEEDTDPVDD